jgi:hypothetical protein
MVLKKHVAPPGRPKRTNAPERGARPQDATDIHTSLDFARSLWYSRLMTKSVRNVNFMHMTRFGWAVEGVVR